MEPRTEDKTPSSGRVTNDMSTDDSVVIADTRDEERPTEQLAPHLASVGSLWSRPVRIVVIGVVLVASLVYVLFGTVLARNVTFNMSRAIDPGASNGIPRYSRETITDIWRTMWDKAPDFGSVDATRGILLIATVAFFLAFAAIILLVFVPGRSEWTASLDAAQGPDRPASE